MQYSPKKIIQILEKNHFNLKKKFGQNFIIDENIINNIISKSNIDSNTLVIEVGPGAGALTYKLADVAKKVICYEIDETLKDVLSDVLFDKDNVEVIYQDFLKANVSDKIKDEKYDRLYVVGNLPYYITTPIIIKLIEDKINVDKIIVMVQKEVGERFKAKPGSKDYSSLSIFLNYYFEVTKIMDISRNIFIPKPNVDSIVVLFSKKESKQELKNENTFFKLIRDSFKQKRKTIKNNLNLYNLSTIEKILNKHGFDLSTRAERIPIEVFIDMANEIGDRND